MGATGAFCISEPKAVAIASTDRSTHPSGRRASVEALDGYDLTCLVGGHNTLSDLAPLASCPQLKRVRSVIPYF